MKGENEKLRSNRWKPVTAGSPERVMSFATTSGSRFPAARIGDNGFPRGDLHQGVDEATATGTSIFDPVLCELVYRWFCFSGGSVLDPFAGGSVRGIVASKLGLKYTGIDLSEVQIKANREQADKICSEKPVWIVGDSANIKTLAPGDYDLIFSCPPYFDLEIYGEDKRDLSTLSWEDFLEKYRVIIWDSVGMLKDNRFACFVVGDIRDKKGFYRGLPWETIQAFQDAGTTLYNEAVLITAVGSLPIRIGKQFGNYRKLGKTHQNVLVFYKGDPKKIKDQFPEIEVSEIYDAEGS